MNTLTMPSITGGTDHLSFDAVGIPGFQFIQDPIEYERAPTIRIWMFRSLATGTEGKRSVSRRLCLRRRHRDPDACLASPSRASA